MGKLFKVLFAANEKQSSILDLNNVFFKKKFNKFKISIIVFFLEKVVFLKVFTKV